MTMTRMFGRGEVEHAKTNDKSAHTTHAPRLPTHRRGGRRSARAEGCDSRRCARSGAGPSCGVWADGSRTHPPGPVLFLWAVRRLFGPGLVPAWLATVLFTATACYLVYFIARRLEGEAVARASLALFLLTPNVVLFTTTSMDGPFSVFLLLALASFLRAVVDTSVIRPSGSWFQFHALLLPTLFVLLPIS